MTDILIHGKKKSNGENSEHSIVAERMLSDLPQHFKKPHCEKCAKAYYDYDFEYEYFYPVCPLRLEGLQNCPAFEPYKYKEE